MLNMIVKYFAFLFFLSIPIFSAPITVGESFSPMTFTDQHETEMVLDAKTKLLLFSGDMDAGKLIHSVFSNTTNSVLKQKQILLVADVHKMPTLISKFVALPKMKKYSYNIALIKDQLSGTIFPFQKGKVTVFYLENLQCKDIQYISTIEELKQVVGNLSE